MSSLAYLEASFVVASSGIGFAAASTIQAADGVTFRCPRCAALYGLAGAHHVAAWSSTGAAPRNVAPPGTRFLLVGTGLGDLTLVSDPPRGSDAISAACGWLGNVVNGSAL